MALSINASGSSTTHTLRSREQQQALNLARLSTGLKLTKAADGPASLIISEQLRAQLEGLSQASDNLSEGIGLLRTADAGVEQIQNLLQKQRDLAVQASSTATTDPAQLAVLDQQFQNLGQAIDTIAKNTQYAGSSLLDGSFQNRQIQGGAEAGQTVSVSIATQGGGFDQAGLGTAGQSLTAPGGAAAALASVDAALQEVGDQRGQLGALEADTVDALRSSVQTTAQNLQGARSVIADTDIAEASANLVRDQILLQSSVAARAQQNVSASSVLRLLGG